jgi:hypothetical protein
MTRQATNKLIFHIHRMEELLHPNFRNLDGHGVLYFFSQGILVEIHAKNSQLGMLQTIEMSQEEMLLSSLLKKCVYRLSKGKSSRYILEDLQEENLLSPEKNNAEKNNAEKNNDQKPKTKKTHEILRKRSFDSFTEIFRYQKKEDWNPVRNIVVFFRSQKEAFPFLENILLWRNREGHVSKNPTKNTTQNTKKKNRKNTVVSEYYVASASWSLEHREEQKYFVLMVENPDVFLCLQLQRFFEKNVAEQVLRGVYELYTSPNGSFYIPFQQHHPHLEYIKCRNDAVRSRYVFIPKSINQQLVVHLELSDIDDFVSYYLSHKGMFDGFFVLEENMNPQKGSTKTKTKIPIEVGTRKTRQDGLPVGWFFEDIDLGDLKKHLSYITDEEMVSKKLQYIIAEEREVFVQQDTKKTSINDSLSTKTHLLIFSLEGVVFRHPTFHKIAVSLQKPFEEENLYINTDEILSPQVTLSTAQKLFELYKEDHFACVFLGTRTFVFPKYFHPLSQISQHILNHETTRLEAYIDKSLWQLKSWINLPKIPTAQLYSSNDVVVQKNSIQREQKKEMPSKSEKEILKVGDSVQESTDFDENVGDEKSSLDGCQILPKPVSQADGLTLEEAMYERISNIVENPTIEEERLSYQFLYQYLQNRLLGAPSNLQERKKVVSWQREHFLEMQEDVILTGIVRLYLGASESSQILNDINEIYVRNYHQVPIFLEILSNLKSTTSRRIEHQEFLSGGLDVTGNQICGKKVSESEDISLHFSGNIFIQILCWKEWLPRSKNVRLWNQVRPLILKRAKVILQHKVYPQQIHHLLSMNRVLSSADDSKENCVVEKENPKHFISTKNYISKKNIEDFFETIQTSIQSLSERIRRYAHLFFSIYAPDHNSHLNQLVLWQESQHLVDNQSPVIQNILHEAHQKGLQQLQLSHQRSLTTKSPMYEALVFLQKLIQQSADGNFDLVLNEIFSVKTSRSDTENLFSSKVSEEEDDFLKHKKILVHVQETFLNLNVMGIEGGFSYSEQFFITHRIDIARALRIEALHSQKLQSALKKTLLEVIERLLLHQSVKNFRVALWTILTLLQGTSDMTTDVSCIEAFEKIQQSLSDFVQKLPNPLGFGTMQRYHVATIYLAGVQFLPFERRLEFVCHINALLNKETKELHMFRHFYLTSVALFSDQFLKNRTKENFVIREYMRIISHIQEIDETL